MRRALILLHLLSLVLFLGAAVAGLVVERPLAVRPIVYQMLLPGFGLSLVTGCLLLMIAESALTSRWFWLKTALLFAVLITVVVYLLPAVNQAAEAAEVSGIVSDSALNAAGWATAALTLAIVALSVIRPRLGQPRR